MTLPVIVTRTLPDADETVRLLISRGFKPIMSPMLALEPLRFDRTLFSRARHIVFTSANGARAVPAAQLPSGITAWCVGPATAAAAADAGYAAIIEGPGNAADLARLISETSPQPQGLFVHVANEDAAGDLVARLSAAGKEAVFIAAYRTQPSPALSPAAIAALAAPATSILLLHSARAAAAVAASAPDLTRAAAVALSAAALAPLAGCAGRGDFVAARPREADLMAALDAAAAAVRG